VFIAEGGPECLESKAEGIQKCLNDTFGKYSESLATANLTDLSNFNLPLILFDEGQCKWVYKFIIEQKRYFFLLPEKPKLNDAFFFSEIDQAAECAVKVLEGCRDPTPANVVESVLKVIKKVIPCKTPPQQSVRSEVITAGTSASSHILGAPFLLLIGLALVPLWFSSHNQCQWLY
jgi:Protein of unknown function (DUF1397)